MPSRPTRQQEYHINKGKALKLIREPRHQVRLATTLSSHGAALKPISIHALSTTHKAIHGWFYTGHWQDRIEKASPAYPFCQQEETNHHRLVCADTLDDSEVALAAFYKELGNMSTAPAIKQSIRQRLQHTMSLPGNMTEVVI